VLEISGPNLFRGYWRNPEKTAEEIRADGFFITGDVATMAEDGRVRIVGRAKDLIISGGFNIYPKEIELVIDAVPGVGESAAIGVPHPDLGEAVVVGGDAGRIGRGVGRARRARRPARAVQATPAAGLR
jgi:malonyl-CoA/methylmalonyl-CoA synthetase